MASLNRSAVFFDRDGVLNVDVDFAHRPDQIVWVEGAAAAVRRVNAAGLYAFVVTNQSGVARGFYTEADVEALHAWMAAELAGHGARIDAFAYCPHHPDFPRADGLSADCRRRKPAPGMLEDLAATFEVDKRGSFLIGDRPTDLQAAHAFGIPGLLFEGGDLDVCVAQGLTRFSARAAEL